MTPFLESFAETGDWATWGILADKFADEGDEIGEAWARWVLEKRRKPQLSTINSWEWFTSNAAHLSACLTNAMASIAVLEDDKGLTYRWLQGDRSVARAYSLCLELWRLLDDDEREAAKAWLPHHEILAHSYGGGFALRTV